MADVKISALSAASALTGAEQVPVVQGGTTKRTTTGAIAAFGGGYTTLEVTTDSTTPYDVPNDGSYIIIVTTDGLGAEQIVNLTYPPELPNSGAYPQNYSVIVLLESQVNGADTVKITIDGSVNGNVYGFDSSGNLSGQLKYSSLLLDFEGGACKYLLGLYEWRLDPDYDQNDKTVSWTTWENGITAIGGQLTVGTIDNGAGPGILVIRGGDGLTGNLNGAPIQITAGGPHGSGNGGTVTVTSGVATNAAGAVISLAGAHPNIAGELTLTGGDNSNGAGGNVHVVTGSSTGGGGNGGAFRVNPGNGNGGGVAGGIEAGGGPFATKDSFLLIVQINAVADLPDPTTVPLGMIGIATDALAPAIGAVAVGGGTVRCLVTSDGANWLVG
jgi:hypothetical protein